MLSFCILNELYDLQDKHINGINQVLAKNFQQKITTVTTCINKCYDKRPLFNRNRHGNNCMIYPKECFSLYLFWLFLHHLTTALRCATFVWGSVYILLLNTQNCVSGCHIHNCLVEWQPLSGRTLKKWMDTPTSSLAGEVKMMTCSGGEALKHNYLCFLILSIRLSLSLSTRFKIGTVTCMCSDISLKEDQSYRSQYFFSRLVNNGFKISRYQASLSRYKMIKHLHDAGNKANKRR